MSKRLRCHVIVQTLLQSNQASGNQSGSSVHVETRSEVKQQVQKQQSAISHVLAAD